MDANESSLRQVAAILTAVHELTWENQRHQDPETAKRIDLCHDLLDIASEILTTVPGKPAEQH